jgi:hypothetical protein
MPDRKHPKYWSGEVTRRSNALDLEHDVFTWNDPKRIARSLRDSAERSTRRKGTPYQSAMSMLNFYINRAGSNLSAQQIQVLRQAKDHLRKLYGRQQASNAANADTTTPPMKNRSRLSFNNGQVS